MTRASLPLVGLLAGALALGATAGGASAQEGEEELTPCEWFIDLAEDYPELEILECEDYDSDGDDAADGLLTWDGREAYFQGGAGWWYLYPPRQYDFYWFMGDEWAEPCEAVTAWREEVGEVPVTRGQERLRYEVKRCWVMGYAFSEGGYHYSIGAGILSGPTPGVFFKVGGHMEEQDRPEQTTYYLALLFHDLRVDSLYISSWYYDLPFCWGGYFTGRGGLPSCDDDMPAPGDTGTGLAPPGYFIPAIAGRLLDFTS